LVIVGGAPCQPFSKAGYWLEKGKDAAYRRARARGEQVEKPAAPTEVRPDDRRSLVEEFARIVIEAMPDGFVFENVPSILHPRNRPTFDALNSILEAAGYHTTMVKANAVAYGVAQKRERVFLLGSLHSLPEVPEPTHDLVPTEGSLLLPPVSSSEAISLYSGIELDEPETVVQGKWAAHLSTVPPGWNYKAHTEWGGHPSPTFVTETRFWNFLLKLDPSLPSWTIPASPGPWTGPFHWDTRRLFTHELAALQTFPDGYSFAGSRRERVRQLGNAVPSLLAAHMTASIMRACGHETSSLGGRDLVCVA
jgi:DNA (cytosine-5)-methyltransferase 1